MQVDDHTVTILRGTGLKDRLSRDRIVKAPPLRSNVEEPLLRRLDSNGKDGNFHEHTSVERIPSTPALASSHTPSLMDVITGREREDALSRLAGFRSQVGKARPGPGDTLPVPGARSSPPDPPSGGATDTSPATRSQITKETLVPPEPPAARTVPPGPRRVGLSAPPAIDPAHRALIASGVARLAA